ncbi:MULTISPECIES: HigA family addiction module antitoxin [unclassified Leeuwenhoekiella]|uniref:HigA family addiction module antitoxin n=1 Tax=unclassified Leeuwenhoekiella TaxID=2615029 RepID=UPI000C6A2DBA|nr:MULTISPECIES: HigA family addiction module antitoxin [unclassified Leeuwenhoekiella]MAW95685.1 addiction module antidote protein, HigA family [Leeuwenhoekiella sp.]MBA80765.1 addiction module antidote protein, HigA family [Leeuwenhoekiella sp.]|tara:strand:+ start:3178 stop:3690 length:513 start_codon:yes stop_codon:yes gene_type:complete
MLPDLEKIKGVHPGAVLKRALKKKDMNSSELALTIDEHKQTLSAILNGRRAVNPKLSIKLAEVFHMPPDYFMVLQASYDVQQALESKPKHKPDLKRFRKALFWDTQLDKIDWNKNKRAVIKRVLERGNQQEIEELIKYYGKQTISTVVQSIKTSYLPSFEENVKHYSLAE